MYQDEPGDELDSWLKSEQDPWSACPRDLRLRAFRELPALLQAIASKAKELVCGVEVTSRQAQEILQSLDADLGVKGTDSHGESAV